MPRSDMIDVYSYHGSVNWAAVADDEIYAACFRIGTTTSVDGQFVSNRSNSEPHLQYRIMYWIYKDDVGYQEQVETLMDLIGTMEPGEGLAVQVFNNSAGAPYIGNMTNFLGYLRSQLFFHGGRFLLVYGNPGTTSGFSLLGTPLWIGYHVPDQDAVDAIRPLWMVWQWGLNTLRGTGYRGNASQVRSWVELNRVCGLPANTLPPNFQPPVGDEIAPPVIDDGLPDGLPFRMGSRLLRS